MPLYNNQSLSAPAIVTNGLKLDYQFNQASGQQLTDFSPNFSHGILGNSATDNSQDPTWITWADAGLDFVADQYISVPGSVNFFSNSFYCESIIYPRSYPKWARIADFSPSLGSTYGNIYFGFSRETTGTPVFGILEGANSTYCATNIAIPLYKWSHLAFSFDSGFGTIYLNCVPIASGALPTPSNVVRNINFIGKSQFSGDGYFDGIMSRFLFYSSALNKAERIQNFIALKQQLLDRGIPFV